MSPRLLGACLGALVLVSACSSSDDAPDATAAPIETVAPERSSIPPTSEEGTDQTEPSATATETTETATTDVATSAPDDTSAVTDPPAATSEPADEIDAPPTVDELLALGRPIVLAHAGGEDVHPHSTPYAYAESVEVGVDMLDFDVQLTADGVLVVHHDDTVDRTTDGTGAVGEMTYDELAALDNAYWFTAGCACRDRPAEEYVLRGVRTGDAEPPAGYTPEDFVIPRFRDIVTRFPTMPLNVEIKGTGDAAVAAARVLASELAELDRLANTVVTSFDDDVVDAFAELAPDVELTPGLGAASAWVLGGEPLPDGMRILQLPPEFQGIDVLTPEVIAASSAAGYPIWVWPNDRAWENADGYQLLLDMGMDGLNINDPAVGVAAVEAWLADDTVEEDDLAAAAASAAQAAIEQGDVLGGCPFGPTDQLVAVIPDRIELAEGFATAGVEDNGQVFSGGDVDIVYCVLAPDDASDGSIDEIRVDVSPLAEVELATYLPEQFTSDDVSTHFAGLYSGGRLDTGCWDGSATVCGAFWQGDGLFIAAVLIGEADQNEPDAVTVAKALVPLVIERLAAATT